MSVMYRKMDFFSTIRQAEPALIHNILRYIEHPLALSALSAMQQEGILRWKEYNACWYSLWKQRVINSPYLPQVDFGHAYTIALCATTLYDDIFQPRQAGATLDHVTQELITWREPYISFEAQETKAEKSIMSSLRKGEYFSPTFCLSKSYAGETVANVVKSFEREVGWSDTLAYVTKHLTQVIIGTEESDNVSCLSALMHQREISALSVIFQRLETIPFEYVLYFVAYIPDEVELFRAILSKGMRAKDALQIFTRCYNARNIPYLEVLCSAITIRRMGVTSVKGMITTDASRKLFEAGVQFFKEVPHEVACVFLGYREGFLRTLRGLKPCAISVSDAPELYRLVMSCIRLKRYIPELLDYLDSNKFDLVMKETDIRIIAHHLSNWHLLDIERFERVLSIMPNSVVTPGIATRICNGLSACRATGCSGVILRLQVKVIRGCTAECHEAITHTISVLGGNPGIAYALLLSEQ